MTENKKAHPQPIALALELSQRDGSIAMCNNVGKTVVHNTASGKRGDDDVMPAIALAAKELGIKPSDVELIVVSIGPGGFTGLRTATSIAKMVSFATGARIITIESAIAVAASSGNGNGPFLVVSNVKRESFWLSRVECKKGSWVCEAGILHANELDAHLRDIIGVFADEYLPDSARECIAHHDVSIKGAALNAEVLLEVGLTRNNKRESVDAADLLPLYPREPEAVRKWNTDPPKT